MLIDVQAACTLLRENDNFLIFAHQKPDGDTFGAAFTLLWTLEALGKRARVSCSDGFSARYGFIYGDYEPDMAFEPQFIIAVDIANLPLIGPDSSRYAGRVDLCIDHHKSNTLYAKATLLDPGAPAASQIVYEVVRALGVPFSLRMANAIFTGLATDTGCFKYSNVTSATHRAAANMIDAGAQHAMINKLMFDTKSRGRIAIERLMMETMRFYFDDRCALVVLPEGLDGMYGVTEDELDGISAFSVRIEGVMAGITIRTNGDGTYRVSLRTVSPVDASKICEIYGGGGHANAAGCTATGSLADIEQNLLAATQKELEKAEP